MASWWPSHLRKNQALLSLLLLTIKKRLPVPMNHSDVKKIRCKNNLQQKGLKWPANYIYIRSFKYDSQLEVWVKNEMSDPFKLFKTYKVCALAGTLGPKRMEGDYQVPEGFYYINEFNPKSNYYLSLGYQLSQYIRQVVE